MVQQSSNGGSSWSGIHDGAATSKSLSGLADGSYTFRVQACNPSGCSGWKAGSATLVVVHPPGSAPSMIVPATSSTGSYVVDWTGVAGRTHYNLQESVNSGSWAQIYVSHGEVWNASNKPDGSYGYRAQACNAGGCGPWSATGTTTVVHPPGSAPSMIVPTTSSTGS